MSAVLDTTRLPRPRHAFEGGPLSGNMLRHGTCKLLEVLAVKSKRLVPGVIDRSVGGTSRPDGR